MTAEARFQEAVSILPERLRYAALGLSDLDRKYAEEVRLRVNRVPTVLLPAGECPFGTNQCVDAREIAATLEAATRSSVHSALESMRGGYLPLAGGHRLGLCGTAVVRDGQVGGIREIGSLCLRIARAMPGVADTVLKGLLGSDGHIRNTLILSPPGGGKTTLLRDLIRQLSDGIRPFRVSVADERGEIAACLRGVPQLDVGAHTDVLDGCPKSQAALWLLRSMNPEILALDEITDPEDAAALRHAACCGCSVIATAHAACWEEFRHKPLFASLGQDALWDCAVEITRKPRGRCYRLIPIR